MHRQHSNNQFPTVFRYYAKSLSRSAYYNILSQKTLCFLQIMHYFFIPREQEGNQFLTFVSCAILISLHEQIKTNIGNKCCQYIS